MKFQLKPLKGYSQQQSSQNIKIPGFGSRSGTSSLFSLSHYCVTGRLLRICPLCCCLSVGCCWLLLLVLLVLFESGTVNCTDAESLIQDQGSSSNKEPITIANYSGDILIGAVLPIHEREKNYSCGALQVEGLQQLEALAFSLKRINDDPNILPGIKVGLMAIDSCDNPHHALEQTIDFIKSFVARNNRRLADHEYKCRDQSPPIYKSGQFDRVLGLIGGQSSEVSIQLANLLRLFQIPQVSFMSTSPTLSNKRLYENFFRTVPSDTYQVIAIVEILRKFHWTYVSVVYSDTEYGNNGYDLLTETAASYNICISSPQAIDVERFRSPDYDKLITTLMHKINARVVILYTDRMVARKVMRAAKRRLSPNRLDRFVWIASDAWCCREFVVHGLEEVVEGSISVTPLHYPLEGFDDYFRSLRPENNQMNPWFREFWQQHFNCALPGPGDDDEYDSFDTNNFTTYYGSGGGGNGGAQGSGGSNVGSSDYDRTSSDYYSVDTMIFNATNRTRCDPSLMLGDEMQQAPSLHFVRDALYSFTKTIDQIHKQLCNGTPGICPDMWSTLMNGQKLTQHLRTVTFNDEGGRTFRFLQNGDAPPRYSVVNFQQLKNGTYQWLPIGTYTLRDNETKAELRLDPKLPQFKKFDKKFPLSFCSEPCQMGQAKLQLEGDTCCWLCTNCSQYQYLPDQFHCADCPLGKIPGKNKKNCVPLPAIHLSITNWWTISAILFACAGIVATISTFVVFWYYAETPIIKASGRELSTLHLVGILLSFGTTFVIISPPTSVTCALTRFFLGFCFTICYSAIVTKTNRIARIFRHRSCQRPKFTSPRSQLIITAILILVEMAISLFWIFYDPPGVMFVYPNRDTALLICSGSDRTSYLVGLLYPLVLIGFCTVYAFKTRKCPEGFNEARYITFTNYTTCVIWFAFLPLFVMLSTTTPLRSVTLCLLLSVSGTVQLFCLFVPKIYIALLKPEKNTRETVMCGGLYKRPMSNSTYLSSHHNHHHHDDHPEQHQDNHHQFGGRNNTNNTNYPNDTTTATSSSVICCEESALSTLELPKSSSTTNLPKSGGHNNLQQNLHHNQHPRNNNYFNSRKNSHCGNSSSSGGIQLPVSLGIKSSSPSSASSPPPSALPPSQTSLPSFPSSQIPFQNNQNISNNHHNNNNNSSSLRLKIDRYSTSSEIDCITITPTTATSATSTTITTICPNEDPNSNKRNSCNGGCSSCCGRSLRPTNSGDESKKLAEYNNQLIDIQNLDNVGNFQKSQRRISRFVAAAAIYWRQYKKPKTTTRVVLQSSGSISDQMVLRGSSSSCSGIVLENSLLGEINPKGGRSLGTVDLDLLSGDPLLSDSARMTPNGILDNDVFIDLRDGATSNVVVPSALASNLTSSISSPMLLGIRPTVLYSPATSNGDSQIRAESICVHNNNNTTSLIPVSLTQSPRSQSFSHPPPAHSICTLTKHDTVLENRHEKNCWPSVRLEPQVQK